MRTGRSSRACASPRAVTCASTIPCGRMRRPSILPGRRKAARERPEDRAAMKIVDLKCALIGGHPIVRVVTDEGISGYAQIEHHKAFIKPHVLTFRDALIGADPTNVERVMLRIRQRGAFKPYGSAVSAIEMALWDVAGKAAGGPVHKIPGGHGGDEGGGAHSP